MRSATHFWSRRAGTVLAVASVCVAAAVLLVVVSDARMPVLLNDEAGYLGAAQILSGVGDPRELSGRGFYYIGWSMVLAPLWWISSDPTVVYRLAVAAGALTVLATILPLAAIGRRMGLDVRLAVVLGAIAVVAPGRAVLSGLVLAEPFLGLLLSLVVLAGLRFHESATLGRAVTLLAVSWGAYFTHGRMTPILVAAALWILIARRRQWVSTVGAVVGATALAAAAYLLYRWIASLMYDTAVSRESTGLDRLLGLDPFVGFQTAVGQLWYVAVAWLGFATLGGVVIASRLVRRDGRGLDSARLGLLAGVVAGFGVFYLSVAWITPRLVDGTARLDMFTYGRYLDPMTGVIAFLGLTWFALGVSRRVAIVAAALQVAVAVLFMAFAFFFFRSALVLDWVPTSVPGLLAFDWPFVTSAAWPPWIPGSVAAVLAGAAIGFGRAGAYRWIVIALAGVIFAAGSVLGEVKSMRPFFHGWPESFALHTVIAQIGDEPLSFDTAGLAEQGDTVSQNGYQFLLAPHDVPVFDSGETDPETELVIARRDWPAGEAAGAILIAKDTVRFDNALWVLPGPLADRLVAEGMIEG